MKTYLEIQQREDISRDLAVRMKFVPPDLRTGQHVFYWQEDPNKFQQDGWSFKFYCFLHFSSKCKQTKKTFRHGGFGRTSRFAWGYRSPCAFSFSRSSNRCLGDVLWQFLFQCQSWSTRTFSGSSQLTSELKNSERFFTTAVAGLLVKAQR